MFDLTGRTALVTGAGQSIGAGIAHRLAAQGAHVVVNDIVAERADHVTTAINNAGGTAEASVFDITDLEQVRATIDSVPLDIVVNNAGNAGASRMKPQAFAEMTPEDWAAPLDVNLHGLLHTTHVALPGMIERGWGRLIVISSGAGTAGVPIGVAPYSAAKGGAQAFVRAVAAENAAKGITANSVAVGLIENAASSELTAAMARTVPVGRVGTAADVAPLVGYLASDEAEWVTGQTMHVNGGSLMT